MAADRRTLLLAGAAMLGLVAVGVISGALFARSACATIAPQAVVAAEVIAGEELVATGPAAAITTALGTGDGTDEQAPGTPADVEAALTALVERVGEVTSVVPVQDVDRLAATPDGVAALGEVVTVVEAGGGGAAEAVPLQQGVAVGAGAHLYSLALTNPLTGQVDALQPLDTDLSGMTCVDTALVGSPLAFHLDAGGGELLLLRIDEDGDDAELELRDPVAGRRWAADLELPTAPAGLAGARLTGRLGPELVVAATRTGAGDGVPVVTGVDRVDGAARWSLDRDDLAAAGIALPGAPVRAEVAAVGSQGVLVGLREVDGEGQADEEAEQDALARGDHRLLLLDAADGAVLAVGELGPGERVAAADLAGGAAEVVVSDLDAGTVRVLQLTADGLEERLADVLEGVAGGLAADPEGALRAVGRGPAGIASDGPEGGSVVAMGGALVLLDGTDVTEVALPAIDAVSHPGGRSVLLAGEDGARAVVTFDG